MSVLGCVIFLIAYFGAAVLGETRPTFILMYYWAMQLGFIDKEQFDDLKFTKMSGIDPTTAQEIYRVGVADALNSTLHPDGRAAMEQLHGLKSGTKPPVPAAFVSFNPSGHLPPAAADASVDSDRHSTPGSAKSSASWLPRLLMGVSSIRHPSRRANANKLDDVEMQPMPADKLPPSNQQSDSGLGKSFLG